MDRRSRSCWLDLSRRLRRHRDHRQHHRRAAERIHRVRPGKAERGDQNPAQRRTDHHRQRAQPVVERERTAQLRRRDQAGHDCRGADVLERREPGEQGRQRVHHHKRGMTEPRRQREPRRGQHETDLVEQEQRAAVNPVGDRPSEERGGHERDDLDRAEQPDEQRRMRLHVDLVGQRDERRLRAEPRDEAAKHDQAQVAAVAQWREIGSQAAQAQATRIVYARRADGPTKASAPGTGFASRGPTGGRA